MPSKLSSWGKTTPGRVREPQRGGYAFGPRRKPWVRSNVGALCRGAAYSLSSVPSGTIYKNPMPLTSDTKKVMFEIYRDTTLNGQYKVVYFTELGEHDKESEIADAMRGEHVFDGFLLHRERQEGKQVVSEILDRLNRGESIDANAIEERLKPYLAR